MFIRTETTPDRSTRTILPGQPVRGEGPAYCLTHAAAARAVMVLVHHRRVATPAVATLGSPL